LPGGAGDEVTLRENADSWNRLRLRPRVLTGVTAPDTRVTLLNETLPHPILLAPTAYHRIVHPDGEMETARGAAAAGAPFVVSTSATIPIEEIARAAAASASSAPLWFQLYIQPDRGFTRALVERREARAVARCA
jgi:4-hydroxymandelate oxidase